MRATSLCAVLLCTSMLAGSGCATSEETDPNVEKGDGIFLSDEELIAQCQPQGVTAIRRQAASWRCSYDESQIQVSGVDNRWYNPSAYVWYAVPASCANGFNQIQVMVQYYAGTCEFRLQP